MGFMTDEFKLRKLDADERPRFLYRATFEGSGAFPLDMLRYDGCWPASSEDVFYVTGRNQTRRRVTVIGHYPFTVARWQSFGWHPAS